ncbi:MAG: NADH:flavin oxidoreductase/NADH oxidase [Evtepia sp.]|jgi:2,4-dienoyl-CoA reductase-like NADH-dependent reductase (Old Yellow Enzyme family)|nr:NADH:flavin oxidoreductase/NADH oxidase [Evtepia sp.]
MSSKLFTPGKIGTLSLNNRLIRSATQDPFGQPDGTANEAQITLHKEIAGSGVPLIITAYTYISPDGRATDIQVGFCNEEHYQSQKKVLDAVHEQCGKMILQINHAGQNVYFMPNLEDPTPLAPSGNMKAPNGLMTREITKEDMDRLCNDYVAAAVKGKELGFDGVQLHCAHGYLLNQFMDPNYNKREDEFGGSAENRFRFIRRILIAMREALGKEYPIIVKMNTNCAGEADDAYGEDLIYFCKQFEELGVDAIELSGFDWIAQGKQKNHNYYMQRAKAVRAAVNIPLIFVGGVRTQADIETALGAGMDFISMSRPFISQPDLIKHLAAGEDSRCQSCSKCFVLWEREGRRCVLHDKPEEKA